MQGKRQSGFSRGVSLISPARLNAYFATITAIISLIIAAATIVPDTIAASEGSKADNVVVAIPVNTSETPEWGSRVKPRYFVTAGGALVNFPPI